MSRPEIGYLIKNINDKLKAKADMDAKELDLTLSQSFVLTFLKRNGGQATQKDVERFLEVSHPAVVGILSRMEQNGQVVTWINPDNRRVKMVRLTAKAYALGDEMDSMRNQWENDMLDGFSDEEVRILKNMLERVNENMMRGQSR